MRPFDQWVWLFQWCAVTMGASALFLMDKYWSRLNPDSSESELINNNRFRGKSPEFLQ